ncbi:MAG: hypothetical protein WKF75_16745 [Singulisphaera sp.]
MATDRINNPRAFRDFLDVKLLNGGANLALDDALGLWEHENQADAEREETHRAIQRGLDDRDAGRTVDAFEFVGRMRQKFRPFDER